MKKSLLITLLMAAFFVSNANSVDVNTAKEIGSKFLKASTNVKAGSELKLVKTYSIDWGDAAFYVFNADNGYVIVAADDCATPILAYSDEGIFDVNNIPVQFEEYLEGFVEQIQYGIEDNIVADEKTSKQWNSVKTTGHLNENRNTPVVGPLLDGKAGKWGQGSPYNLLCPVDANNKHALVGCVALSMGQIMRYHGFPQTGSGLHEYTPAGYSTQTVDFSATTYDWTNMLNELTNSSTAAQKTAVATLLYHCGVAVDMMYGTSGSGSYSEDVPYALKTYFNYSNDMSDGYRDDYDNLVWLARVKASLDLGYPIHYSGARVTETGGRSGHAFVCDGYDTDDLLHFNWGWNGSANAYCAVNALDADGRKYIYENYAVFNIHPSTDATLTHTVSVSSNNTDLGTVSGGGSFANGVTTTVAATPAEGKVFCYWSENGGIVSTDNPYQFEVLYNRNLTAVFAEPNSIVITASVLGDVGGTVTGGGAYSYGQEVTVKATPTAEYTFMYWLNADNEIISSDAEYKFTATESCGLTTRFAPSSSVCEIIYTLVDGYLEYGRGNKLNVKYEGTYTETLSWTTRVVTSITRKVIDESNVKLSWTPGPYANVCQLSLKHGEGDVFYETTSITPGYNYEFTMSCASGSPFTFNGTNSNLWSLASNWASGNKPDADDIAGVTANVIVDEDVTVATLNLYDGATLTIPDGKILTVTGSIAEMDNAKIVIEEGGQLVNSSYYVSGIMKTSVTAWDPTAVNKGWYAISSPVYVVLFSDVTNLTNDTYNIYRYNEATMTWENCQYSGNTFDRFENGPGYLYRKNTAATLEFDGYFYNTYAYYQLSNAAPNSNLKGFNLVGNPYPHNIYKGEGTAIPNTYLKNGFYTLESTGAWLPCTDNTTAIKPCQAILVQALSGVTDNYLQIENKTSSGTAKDVGKHIRFSVSNADYEDVAYVVFNDGEGLNKIAHRNEDMQMLYIRNNDEDFAVADIEDTTHDIDLHFKAATAGQYTITVETCHGASLQGIRLIDKFENVTIDLGIENKYSFIGSPADAENRFIVKLSENQDAFDDNFAYQSGESIIVCGEGILQVYDITGRMISTQRISGVETIEKPSQNGVYIFRLLGNEVKTQKILVK